MDKDIEFKNGVRGYLNSLNEDIEKVLTQLICYDFPGEVDKISFEVFADGFTQYFPVRAFFMDDSKNEFFIMVDGKAEYPSPVDPALLDIPYVYPDEFEDKFIAQDENFDSYTLATEELIQWFSERWNAVGGANFKLKASIAPHDSTTEYNLVISEWEEIY